MYDHWKGLDMHQGCGVWRAIVLATAQFCCLGHLGKLGLYLHIQEVTIHLGIAVLLSYAMTCNVICISVSDVE